MPRRMPKSAFTLIELLVVVAIIALLISILLPSLSAARNQGKRAVCLTNLRSIAQASHAYATEDKREQIIPLHLSHVSVRSAEGFTGEWNWRTAEPYAFGGRTPTKPFPGGCGTKMMDETGIWAAHTRPLNQYVYGEVDQADSKKLEMFHCPADVGYPKDSQWIQDCPPEASDIAMYDMIGNGYRINPAGLLWVSGGGSNKIAHVSVGAHGHAATTLDNPSRTILYTEPLFYNFTRQDMDEDPSLAPIEGWHKRLMSDNAGFCDGSGRMTRIDKLSKFDVPTLNGMGVTRDFTWSYFLRRGRTWQTDTYPGPGALILVYQADGVTPNGGGPNIVAPYHGWPFDNIRINTPPSMPP